MAIISNNWEQAQALVDKAAQQFLQDFSQAIVDHAIENSPVSTGPHPEGYVHMRDRNKLEAKSDDEVIVYNDAPYAGHVNFGHVVRSSARPATEPGDDVGTGASDAKRVPANPFFTKAVDQAVADAPDIAQRIAR